MDALDRSILRSLFTDIQYPARPKIRESVSALARELHVSETTVRSRVNAYLRSGFLRGWSLFVNPNLVGEHVAQACFDVRPPSAKEDVIEKIRLIDGVWYIAKYHEDAVGVGFFYEDEDSLKTRLELMARIASAEHFSCGELRFPPSAYQFSLTDVAIIKSVEGEPGRAFASIARETRLSTRTVRRRLHRMIEEHVLFTVPIMDFRKARELIAADIFVFYTTREVARDVERAVLAMVDKIMVAAIPGSPDHLYVSVFLENLADAHEILVKLRSLDGVKEAHVNLIEEHLPQYQSFRKQIVELSKTHELGIVKPRPRLRERPKRKHS